jgi:hypothetical protein
LGSWLRPRLPPYLSICSDYNAAKASNLRILARSANSPDLPLSIQEDEMKFAAVGCGPPQRRG